MLRCGKPPAFRVMEVRLHDPSLRRKSQLRSRRFLRSQPWHLFQRPHRTDAEFKEVRKFKRHFLNFLVVFSTCIRFRNHGSGSAQTNRMMSANNQNRYAYLPFAFDMMRLPPRRVRLFYSQKKKIAFPVLCVYSPYRGRVERRNQPSKSNVDYLFTFFFCEGREATNTSDKIETNSFSHKNDCLFFFSSYPVVRTRMELQFVRPWSVSWGAFGQLENASHNCRLQDQIAS